MKTPSSLPPWITEEEIQAYADKFQETGFTGGLNYYRAMTWDLEAPRQGAKIRVREKPVRVGNVDEPVTAYPAGKPNKVEKHVRAYPAGKSDKVDELVMAYPAVAVGSSSMHPPPYAAPSTGASGPYPLPAAAASGPYPPPSAAPGSYPPPTSAPRS
ncbi:hypothetical protein L2E82_08246 [Cichorium intybus]|uniref:Uncharacterized protein n=1 Tax=Cichorium intybus TaxID=13427 RepID=A0ACB9G5R2_CICIN|nr:hypothetical protein L2E82_08246 [Cichorium intybus]